MNSARWLKHPHNCRYVVCTWACWAVKKKKPRGCYVFWSAPPSPCVVLEPAVFSGEHWSSIMTFVGKSSLSPQWTALSCAILVIRFTQHRSGMCTAWWSNPFSVAREIIFFFFFLSPNQGKNPIILRWYINKSILYVHAWFHKTIPPARKKQARN